MYEINITISTQSTNFRDNIINLSISSETKERNREIQNTGIKRLRKHWETKKWRKKEKQRNRDSWTELIGITISVVRNDGGVQLNGSPVLGLRRHEAAFRISVSNTCWMSVDGLHVGVLIFFFKGSNYCFFLRSCYIKSGHSAMSWVMGPWLLFNNTGHKMMESRSWNGKETNIRIRNSFECRIAKCLLIV